MQNKSDQKKFVLISYDQTTIEQIQSDDLEQILASVADDRISWLTMNGCTKNDNETINKILAHFNITSSLTQPILSKKLDNLAGEHRDCLFLDYQVLESYSAENGFNQVTGTIILGNKCLLLFDKDNSGYYDAERQKISNDETRIQDFDVDHLFYLLIHTAVDRTEKLLFVDLTKQFEDLEDRAIAYPGEDFILDEIMALRTQIRPLYDAILRFGNLISFILEEESRFMTDHTRSYFEKNLERDHRDLWDGYREVRGWTTQLMDIHRSNMDEKTNDILKILAIISFIFLPITFLASLYGMNFTNMPEMDWEYAYFAILGIMALIAGGLLLVMKKKGWI